MRKINYIIVILLYIIFRFISSGEILLLNRALYLKKETICRGYNNIKKQIQYFNKVLLYGLLNHHGLD